jgi:DNA primase
VKGVTSEVIAEVRGRASLHEVVSEYVVLKRNGADRYVGLCPFHNEKTASFNVNVDKGFFKCFGCNEAGDVFSFLQKIKRIEFIDAVCDLALKYGVKLVETHQERQEYDKRTAILMLYQQASEYYSHMLADEVGGQKAREYLNNRGIGSDIIDKFKLGFAPDLWDGLLNFLTTNAKAAPQTLLDAGLVRHKEESNRFYDLFKNRLMIPIFDDQGRVIAFGGRTLADDQIKYLNSPETPIYTKGQHLYAFHLAKEPIREKDAVIVVEGYFDVITSHLYGFSNTVATCGTALTEPQAKSLVRYTDSKRVFLAFDADAAGVKAVDRGVETLNHIAEGIGLDLRVIQVPGGKDPDECLRASEDSGTAGPAGYSKAIAEALPLIDYQLQKAMLGANTSTHTGRIDAAKKVVPILAQIKTEVARSQYIQQWSHKLVIDEIALTSDVSRFRKENRGGSRNANYAQPQSQRVEASKTAPASKSHLLTGRGTLQSGYIDAERQLLALYLTSRDDYERVHAVLIEETLLSPEHQQIKEAIEGIGSQFNNVEDLRQKLTDRLAPENDAMQAFVDVLIKVEVMRKQNPPVEILLREFRLTLLAERLRRGLAMARALLATAANETDQQILQSKIIELNKLQKTILSDANTPGEIDALKRKIDQVTAVKTDDVAITNNESLRMETTV